MSLAALTIDACNPGPMTGAGNHTYLLAAGADAVLIDAGVGHPDHLAAVGRALAESGASLATVAVTHHHRDHIGGVPALAAAYPRASFVKYPWPDPAPPDVTWRDLKDREEVVYGGEALTAIHTPGHSPDHIALWHAASRVLFTGDLVIAGGSVVIEASRGGNLAQYLGSLHRIMELEPLRLLPAHGSAIDDPGAVIRSYLEHRRDRERQVVGALQAGHRSVEAIADSIYDGLESGLMPAARENVRAHLEKLASDGVAVDHDGWRLR